ncbi:MBL fold metallo-hydrolase [Chondromyces crocatus]|uniref:Rhodanese domain-containing protein n=1 Tax=Chondromyces crocatus TaxID=52 RepID=A0A0K1EC47_CHOCO|nr:MBL fold metallo-hydrolase [Chondromyces crocatus]AKT38133.1 uncharacterized protein CMC5_022750 [Chondromyces crocatus]
MKIEPFFDPATSTLTYVVYDPESRDAVVIDPVLDYDPLASATTTMSLEIVSSFLQTKGLRLHDVLETHAHADHLSGSQYLKRRFQAKVGIGMRIREVQKIFRDVFDLPPSFPVDGSQFDRLFEDGEKVVAGTLAFEVIATPGHTPACVTYRFGDAIFTGDALFIEDYGTGRCDFPSGSADALFTSVHDRLYALPDTTRVFVGHDYQPNGRPLRYETTIGASKKRNVQLCASTPREAFVKLRTQRDATLAPPRLLYPSVQVNVDAGMLPKPRANGRRYLSIPLDARPTTDDDDETTDTEGRGDAMTTLYESAQPNPAGFRDVLPAQVFKHGEEIRLVDVREPSEFTGELGHIARAELVPLATVIAAAERWRKEDELVLICRSGRRSEQAATALTAAGFRRTMNLAGGMLAWNEARLPVEYGSASA